MLNRVSIPRSRCPASASPKQVAKTPEIRVFLLPVAGLGIEPKLEASKAPVLPLDDPAI